MKIAEKLYLGDSVYADIENGMVKLTTENGLPRDPSNTIYLEPDVMDNLILYYETVKQRVAEITEARQTTLCSHCSADLGPVPDEQIADPVARRAILDRGRLCDVCFGAQATARDMES